MAEQAEHLSSMQSVTGKTDKKAIETIKIDLVYSLIDIFPISPSSCELLPVPESQKARSYVQVFE